MFFVLLLVKTRASGSSGGDTPVAYPSSRHQFEVHASSVCSFTSSRFLAYGAGLGAVGTIGPSVVCLVVDWWLLLFLAIIVVTCYMWLRVC